MRQLDGKTQGCVYLPWKWLPWFLRIPVNSHETCTTPRSVAPYQLWLPELRHETSGLCTGCYWDAIDQVTEMQLIRLWRMRGGPCCAVPHTSDIDILSPQLAMLFEEMTHMRAHACTRTHAREHTHTHTEPSFTSILLSCFVSYCSVTAMSSHHYGLWSPRKKLTLSTKDCFWSGYLVKATEMQLIYLHTQLLTK